MVQWFIRLWRFLFPARSSSAKEVPSPPIAADTAINSHESSPAINELNRDPSQHVWDAECSRDSHADEAEAIPVVAVHSVRIDPERQQEWIDEIETKLAKSRKEALLRKISIDEEEKYDRELRERQRMWQEGERLKRRGQELVNEIYRRFKAMPQASNCEDAAAIDELGSQIKEVEELIDEHRAVMRELDQRTEASGVSSVAQAETLDKQAGRLFEQGKYAEAEPLFKRALAIFEKAIGADHPKTAARLNNLAELYKAQGKYADAEPLHKRALAIVEKAPGPGHPDTAWCLNNLAGLYRAQGKYSDAEPLYKRSLAILEKALGPEHPDTTIPRVNLKAMRDERDAKAKAK
jgi:tetratricopeptide (TPR) repeat protein